MPVFIDRGGHNRCCGDILIADRCGGDFCSNKGTPASQAETFPQRERSNPAIFRPRPTPSKGVQCSSLSARRSFAGKAVSGCGSGRSRRIRRRPAIALRKTFSGSFHRWPGEPRPCIARMPGRFPPNGSGARISRRGCCSLSPGHREGGAYLLPSPGRGRVGNGTVRDPRAADPGGRRAEAVRVGHHRRPGPRVRSARESTRARVRVLRPFPRGTAGGRAAGRARLGRSAGSRCAGRRVGRPRPRAGDGRRGDPDREAVRIP